MKTETFTGKNMSQQTAFSKQDLEHRYLEITSLYDMVEEMVATVESEFVKDPQAQLAIVEPLVSEMGEATDILSEEFLNVVQESGGIRRASRGKSRIESALRKIYLALDNYRQRVGAKKGKAQDALHNIADPIVKKIKRQVERIVAIFVEFIDLSLDRIMHKSEIEELRQKEARVALMLHQMAQQHT